MKKISKLEGIIVPLITPLLTPFELDIEGIEKMLDYVIHGGVSSVFILGTTGEGPLLSEKMKRDFVQHCVKKTAGRVPVLVNVSAASGEDSINFGVFAEKNGASGIVASPPCYMPNDKNELFDFYKMLSESIDLPVYIYNMPEMVKVNMDNALIEEILTLPNIAGLKDSSGNFDSFKVIAEKMRYSNKSIFMGPDILTRSALKSGASGGVNSGANMRPELYSALYDAVTRGDDKTSELFQEKIKELQKVYSVKAGSPGVLRGIKRYLASKGLIHNVLAFPGRPII